MWQLLRCLIFKYSPYLSFKGGGGNGLLECDLPTFNRTYCWRKQETHLSVGLCCLKHVLELCMYAFFFPVICKLSKSTGHMFSFFEFSMAQWIESLCSCTIEVRSRCWKSVEGPKCLHQVQQQLHVFQAVATCCSTWYFIYVVSLIHATFVIPVLQT